MFLTNAVEWRLVRIIVANQISHEEVCWVVLPHVSPRKEDHLQQLFLFANEGLSIYAMDAFHQHAQLFTRFTVAAILRSEPGVGVVRRELRRLFPDIKVGNENLAAMIADEVIKRETIEGEKAKEAAVRIRKAGAKLERARSWSGRGRRRWWWRCVLRRSSFASARSRFVMLGQA